MSKPNKIEVNIDQIYLQCTRSLMDVTFLRKKDKSDHSADILDFAVLIDDGSKTTFRFVFCYNYSPLSQSPS